MIKVKGELKANIDDYIGRELKQKLDNPLVFQREGAAVETAKTHGYDRAGYKLSGSEK